MGMNNEEIYRLIILRRALTHKKSRNEALTQDESDRAVRIASITSLAEEIFDDDARVGRWLRKSKSRFEERSPLAMLHTQACARLVKEMLLLLDYGYAA
jgi:putative toxin-antitoxin system antitoxin component (TIGR02293 family)